MSSSPSVKPEQAFAAFISLALRKQQPDASLSEYWLVKYCNDEVSAQQREQIEKVLAGSDELFTQWLETKQAIAMTNTSAASQKARNRQQSNSFFANLVGWFKRQSLVVNAGLSSAIAASLIVAVVGIQPNTFSSDLDSLTPKTVNYPFIPREQNLKSLKIQSSSWPMHFQSGINNGIKNYVLNADEWQLTEYSQEYNCNQGVCSALENRQFHAGNLIVESYLLCNSLSPDEKPEQLAQAEKLLARYASSFWWELEKNNMKQQVDICESSDVIMRSIFE